MYTLTKVTLSFITILLLLLPSQVSAQQSDFQIIQDFRTGYSELLNKVENAVSTDELNEISEEISSFEAQYANHESLINDAIYPDTFDGLMQDLENNFNISNANISVIEQLNNRVEDLVDEMDLFRNRISDMNQEMVTLEERIEQSSENESRQAALIRQYRLNIDQRDVFVSNFLEELVERYQNMDSSARSEISDASDRLQDNPVDILKTILSEYIQLANSDISLNLSDYVSMRAQHGYFSNVWDRIGTQLTETFVPDGPVVAEQEVEDLLVAWQAAIDNNLWETLAASFSENDIELEPFSSSSEFYTSLNSYIDSSYEASLESNSEQDYQRFLNFNSFWNNTVKANWGELLTTGNVLTYSEISAIDMKLNDWGEASSPTSNLMFILLIVSIAVIVGLVVLLVTKKS
tara:strand:+ start:54427 stop:55647 length:1221 start_codon:yes stop_codon:yes gene_type:complete